MIGLTIITILSLFVPLGIVVILFPFALTSHGVLYRFSRRLRWRWEIQAFKEQFRDGAKTEKSKRHYSKELSSKKYNFNITDDEAYSLLFK